MLTHSNPTVTFSFFSAAQTPKSNSLLYVGLWDWFALVGLVQLATVSVSSQPEPSLAFVHLLCSFNNDVPCSSGGEVDVYIPFVAKTQLLAI